jgi:hypothetical protein
MADQIEKNRNETRQTIIRDPNNPEPHVDSGYEGDDTSDSFTIPPVGIEDADMALFNLFNKDIGFTIRQVEAANKRVQIKKPYVIFATGERFAIAKKLRPPRDKNSQVMLPAISIRRTSIEQTNDDITGRGMNQFSGNIIIKRRLEKGDKDYQNLINKFGFKNLQQPPSSGRNSGIREEENSLDAQSGGLLAPKLGNNMFEIITAPQPQFFTAVYEVAFWTNFTQHMNYLIETYFASFLPNDRIHKLVTPKGYWFLAHTDENVINQENIDDFTEDERVLRYSFNVKVRGYIFAPQHSTNAVPIRRYVSSPTVVFDVREHKTQIMERKHLNRPPQLDEKDKDAKFVLTDIERDPSTKQNDTTDGRFAVRKDVFNPRTGRIEKSFVSILERNEATGETVYRASDVKTLEEFIKTLK